MTKSIKGKFVATTWINSQLLKEFKTICEIKKKDGTALVRIWFKQNKNVIPPSSDWCHGQVNNASLSLMFNNKFYKDFWKKATQLEETRCSLLRYCVEQIVTEYEEKNAVSKNDALEEGMSFAAALALMDKGEKVTKENWFGSAYLHKIENTLAIRYLHETKSHGYCNFNEILGNDWLIYKDPKLCTLAEVLPAFNEGKTIARLGSNNFFDNSNMARIMSVTDIAANDWIILGGKIWA
jgi:hypothetical protein